MKHADISLKTKRTLAGSLKKLMEQKSLSRITISELCRDCGLNRKTFYYHFDDIQSLLKWMLEQEADFQNLPAEILFMVRSREALENAKLQKVLQTFPKIRVYYDTFVPNVETLARRMYVDPEKLPLILVTTRTLNAVYACSGYNVGSGDMIVKVCQSV